MRQPIVLTNKIAVITGAASGIGLELAKKAASENMKLILADIEYEKLMASINENNLSNISTPVKIDVSLESDIKKLADVSFSGDAEVAVLFNNAGVGMNRTTWDHTHSDWEWVMGVNLYSVAHAIRYFVPKLLEQTSASHIVNTASVAGLLSTPGMSAYNASKHGVVTISETLFHELNEINANIGVSLLCPAWVATGIHQSHRNRQDRFGFHQHPVTGLSASYEERMSKAIHSGKLTAKDMAEHTFQAIKNNLFYVIPHRKINNAIELRMKDILNLTNPTPL